MHGDGGSNGHQRQQGTQQNQPTRHAKHTGQDRGGKDDQGQSDREQHAQATERIWKGTRDIRPTCAGAGQEWYTPTPAPRPATAPARLDAAT